MADYPKIVFVGEGDTDVFEVDRKQIVRPRIVDPSPSALAGELPVRVGGVLHELGWYLSPVYRWVIVREGQEGATVLLRLKRDP